MMFSLLLGRAAPIIAYLGIRVARTALWSTPQLRCTGRYSHSAARISRNRGAAASSFARRQLNGNYADERYDRNRPTQFSVSAQRRPRARCVSIPTSPDAPDAAARFQRIVQAYELLTSGRGVAFQPRSSSPAEDIAQRLRREWQAGGAPPRRAEKVEAQRRVSLLVTAAYIAGQYVIWFAFLKAASN